jgi:hypothetical protein
MCPRKELSGTDATFAKKATCEMVLTESAPPQANTIHVDHYVLKKKLIRVAFLKLAGEVVAVQLANELSRRY